MTCWTSSRPATRPGRSDPPKRQGQHSYSSHRRQSLAVSYTRGGQAQVAETTIPAAPNPANCGSWCDAPASQAPKPSCGPTGATTLVTNRAVNTETAVPPSPRPSRRHQRPQRQRRPLREVLRPPRLRHARTQPHPLDHTPRTPNTPNTSPCSCRCRDVSSTTQAATSCACPSTGPGNTPSPQRCNTTQPAPAHINARPGDRHPQHTPQRHQPNPTPTPTLQPQHTKPGVKPPARPRPGPPRADQRPIGGFRLRDRADGWFMWGSIGFPVDEFGGGQDRGTRHRPALRRSCP